MRRRNLACFKVSAGAFVRFYFTEYHAEQMARALRFHGLTATVEPFSLPDDALTRLSVSA